MSIWDFFTPEAGQQRRLWLEGQAEGLLEYVPPELRPWLGVASELNPVTSMERASEASTRMVAPGLTGWERVQAGGDMLSNVAGVVAPAVAARAAGVPVANAVEEVFTGYSPAAGYFLADEYGGVKVNWRNPAPEMAAASDGVAERGAQIMDMLKSGRGAEVTDDMLDMGDAVANARLNEWLFNNYDLPMDAASRAARAGEMGMNSSLYHGTKADVPAFDPSRMGQNEASFHGAGVYSTADTDYANAYTRGEGGNVLPIAARRQNEFVWQDPNKNFKTNEAAREFTNRAIASGYGGVRIPMYGSADFEVVTFDPAAIRSRFARFDPRLAHLRNLTAGLAGVGLLGFPLQDDN